MQPTAGIIMGSDSDLSIMQAAADILKEFGISFELTVVSAHRTPLRMINYAQSARERGLKVIIAGCRRGCPFAGYGGFPHFIARYWRAYKIF